MMSEQAVPLQGLTDDGSQSGEHGPPAVDQLALPEPLQTEDLIVGLQGVAAQLDLLGSQLADLLAGLVHGLVLVKLVQVYLQELTRLCQAEWVKSARAGTIENDGVGRKSFLVQEMQDKAMIGLHRRLESRQSETSWTLLTDT